MKNRQPSDAQLAIRCQLGDREAWDQLVRRWHPRLWAFISQMLSDRATAEDVLQTVWLKIVRSLGRLNDPHCLAAWIFRIARLSVADQLRRQYRTPPAEGWVDYPEDDVAVDVVATTELVRLGLRHLHPTDREAVVLHYIEQLSVAEVADVCGVPAGTIKSRLHRARCVLRQKLA